MQFKYGNIGVFFRGDPTIKRLYTFDNTLTDFTHNYNGSGSISGYRPSKFRYQLAAGFDADESKYITVGATSDLGFVPKSILFWFIKGPHTKSTGEYIIFSKPDYGTAIRIRNSTSNYVLSYYFYVSSSTYYQVISTHTVKDNKWHCCACINDGTKSYLYLDGKLEATSTGGNEYCSNNKTPTIGRDPLSGYDTAFDGKIGEFAIFSRALSSQEIFQYYKWATGVAKKNYVFEPIQPNFFPFF